MKELNEDMKKVLKSINECCIKISEKNKYDIKFNKIDFLEKEGFYEKYPNIKFNN